MSNITYLNERGSKFFFTNDAMELGSKLDVLFVLQSDWLMRGLKSPSLPPTPTHNSWRRWIKHWYPFWRSSTSLVAFESTILRRLQTPHQWHLGYSRMISTTSPRIIEWLNVIPWWAILARQWWCMTPIWLTKFPDALPNSHGDHTRDLEDDEYVGFFGFTSRPFSPSHL